MPGHGGAQLFVLGDDRDNSADSRYWGYVPVDDMHGRPTLIYWSSGDAGVRWNWGRRLRRAQHTGSAPYRRVESNIIPYATPDGPVPGPNPSKRRRSALHTSHLISYAS